MLLLHGGAAQVLKKGNVCFVHYICWHIAHTVYPKKYAHGFCFAVLCCGYTLTDFPISIRLTSLALWQSNDCPSASKATLTNMDKYYMWIHYERLHNHNKAKHNKTVCIFLGICCIFVQVKQGWIYGTNQRKRHPLLLHWSQDNMATISQAAFSSAFPWIQTCAFWISSTEICSLGFNWQYFSTGSNNGLTSNHYLNQRWFR